MTHKELAWYGDIIRENPDRYAYVRQHFTLINNLSDLNDLK